MLNFRYLSLSFLLCFVLACSKSDDSSHSSKDSDDPLHIERAFFTNPKIIKDKSGDPTVMNWLKVYLDHTPKGATVHINIYLFEYEPILTAIKDAYDRGVTIKILIDNRHGDNTRSIATTKKLEEYLDSPSEVVPVNNDARPSLKAIDHNKYVLFSEVNLPDGVAKNLVWASSHNFSKGQTEKLEDAVVMTNEDLYNAFIDNWEEIASWADEGMRNFQYSVNNIGNGITVFFFPRLKDKEWDGKSTVIEELDKLSDYENDTICVLMSEIHGGLGLKIAKKLTELANKGADVQVITRLEEPALSEAVLHELNGNFKDAGGYVKLIDASKTGTVHSKTMLIKGTFDGKEDQEIILTGSLNYHTNATGSNNNFLLMLENSDLFEDYWHNWSLVKEIF